MARALEGLAAYVGFQTTYVYFNFESMGLGIFTNLCKFFLFFFSFFITTEIKQHLFVLMSSEIYSELNLPNKY